MTIEKYELKELQHIDKITTYGTDFSNGLFFSMKYFHFNENF